MNAPNSIFPSIFNSIPEHIAILDENGTIQLVNTAWENYARENGGDPESTGVGINYLAICDASSKAGNTIAKSVSDGLRELFKDGNAQFSVEYPCHSPSEKRWFKVNGWPLQHGDQTYSIICHQDITSCTQTIEKLSLQALTDSLTGVANRRHYDQFLDQEWRRGMRAGTPLSMILLDVDFFKLFNDRYGHAAGDECLKSVSSLLHSYSRRPGDLAVRYGGEEFLILLGGTPLEAATRMAENLRAAIKRLEIANENSTVASIVTASLGVSSIIPRRGLSKGVLLSMADQALYTAKATGRNKVVKSNLRFI